MMLPKEVKYKIDLMIWSFNDAHVRNFGLSCDDAFLYVSPQIKKLMGDKYVLDINGSISEYPVKVLPAFSLFDHYDGDNIFIVSESEYQLHLDEIGVGKPSVSPLLRKCCE